MKPGQAKVRDDQVMLCIPIFLKPKNVLWLNVTVSASILPVFVCGAVGTTLVPRGMAIDLAQSVCHTKALFYEPPSIRRGCWG